jgi:hypothetical protein
MFMTAARFHSRRARQAALHPIVRLRDRFLFSDRSIGAGKWPVRETGSSSNRYQPFFVLGSPRSGTTLLRALLCAHPDTFIPPENGALRAMIRVFGSTRAEPWPTVVAAVLDRFAEGYEFQHWGLDLDELKRVAGDWPIENRSLAGLIRFVYMEYGARHSVHKRHWGDKSTPGEFRYLDKLALVFPGARYVHIVRDGRDCVASSIRAGFFEGDYYQAAYAWRDNVRVCRRFGRGRSAHFLELRYEDLVTSPAREVARLCRFLGIEPVDAMLEHHSLVQQTAPDVGGIGHHENVRRPISKESLGKWRTELPVSALDVVSRIVSPEMKQYGYSLR